MLIFNATCHCSFSDCVIPSPFLQHFFECFDIRVHALIVSSDKLMESTMEKAVAALTEVVGLIVEFLEDAQVGTSQPWFHFYHEIRIPFSCFGS